MIKILKFVIIFLFSLFNYLQATRVYTIKSKCYNPVEYEYNTVYDFDDVQVIIGDIVEDDLIDFYVRDCVVVVEDLEDDIEIDPVRDEYFINGTTYVNQQTNIKHYYDWGLDRIDQKNRPLNAMYYSTYTGKNIHVYVVDTGISNTHKIFDNVEIIREHTCTDDVEDKHGHGTAIASIITHVSPDITLESVKVMQDTGTGFVTDFIDGLNYIYKKHKKLKKNQL